MKKVCLAGCGRLGHVIADGLMANSGEGGEASSGAGVPGYNRSARAAVGKAGICH